MGHPGSEVGEVKTIEGLRPVFFGPCTLGRTWGTRPITFEIGVILTIPPVQFLSNAATSPGFHQGFFFYFWAV
jgi:hypothetical protein